MIQTLEIQINSLRERVCNANIKLAKSGLIISTFGNVSEKVEINGLSYIGIKPSGIQYEKLKSSDIVILSENGEIIYGSMKPSSDTPTHLYLYRHLKSIQGVTHSHSAYATAWAQAGLDIPCYGTTHADYDDSLIPCTEELTPEMISDKYEYNTGVSIINKLKKINKLNSNMILVKSHGPFTFGKSADESVDNSIHLEEIAKMALYTRLLNPNIGSIDRLLHSKHYDRKHGVNKYYGQN